MPHNLFTKAIPDHLQTLTTFETVKPEQQDFFKLITNAISTNAMQTTALNMLKITDINKVVAMVATSESLYLFCNSESRAACWQEALKKLAANTIGLTPLENTGHTVFEKILGLAYARQYIDWATADLRHHPEAIKFLEAAEKHGVVKTNVAQKISYTILQAA